MVFTSGPFGAKVGEMQQNFESIQIHSGHVGGSESSRPDEKSRNLSLATSAFLFLEGRGPRQTGTERSGSECNKMRQASFQSVGLVTRGNDLLENRMLMSPSQTAPWQTAQRDGSKRNRMESQEYQTHKGRDGGRQKGTEVNTRLIRLWPMWFQGAEDTARAERHLH